MNPITRLSSVLVLLGALVAGCSTPSRTQSVEAQRSRAKVAEAMFQERCKTAGVKIHRTVENVAGVFLLKIRPEKQNFGNQFALDDPYGADFGGDAAIRTLLRGQYAFGNKGERIAGAPPRPLGYSYIEAIDPKDGKRYRYTGSVKEVTVTSSIMMGGDGKRTFKTKEFVLERVLSAGPPLRYGVTYDDISTREEREYWIAGSSLRVIDLETNEVIAERIGYMVDWAQGSDAGGRSPWLFAADRACPSFQRNPLRPPGHGAEGQTRQTQYFIEQVLKPTLGD